MSDEFTPDDVLLPSKKAQKKYIMRNIQHVSIECRRELVHLLVRCGHKDLLKECNEGIVLDLDRIYDDETIGQMYGLMLCAIYSRKV